jgi:hypothetical protein
VDLRQGPVPGHPQEPGRRTGQQPGRLLAGNNAIERDYVLKEAGKQGDVEWLSASPKKADNTFNAIRMGFSNKMLVEMELTDSFGNNTRIRFAASRKTRPWQPATSASPRPRVLMWSAATEQPACGLPAQGRHHPASLLQKRSTCRV